MILADCRNPEPSNQCPNVVLYITGDTSYGPGSLKRMIRVQEDSNPASVSDFRRTGPPSLWDISSSSSGAFPVEINDPTRPFWWGFLRSSEGNPLETFLRHLETQKDMAISMLSIELSTGSIKRKPVLDFLFAKLVASRLYDDSPYFDAIVRLFSPEEIYEVAWDAYRKHGLGRRLTLAAAMLQAKGQESWPVLDKIAAEDRPESEFFIGAIASIGGISRARRSIALKNLARNSDGDVRLALVYEMLNNPAIRDPETLELLSQDENEDIREYISDMTCPV